MQLHAFVGTKHSWWDGSWHSETLDATTSASAVASVVYHGQLHYFYNNDITHAIDHRWWASGRWWFEILDGPGTTPGGNGPSQDPMSGPAVTVFNGQVHVFYYDPAIHSLRHAFWNWVLNGWFFETLDGNLSSGGHGRTSTDDVGQYNSTLVFQNQLQDFYWDATAGTLRHGWWDGTNWNFDVLDGPGGGAVSARNEAVGQFSSAVAFGGGLHDFYWDIASAALRHTWWNGVNWTAETLDGPGSSGANGSNTTTLEGAYNSALVYNGQLHEFYMGGSVSTSLRHAWWDGSVWRFETLDGPGSAVGNGRTQSNNVGSYDAAVVYGTQLQDFYHDSTAITTRHCWWNGLTWSFEVLP